MTTGGEVQEPIIPRLNILNGSALVIVSASVIALQIVLMRCLAITRYHHFSYLVIATALLGFGLSGTFLTFFKEQFRKRFMAWSQLSILLFSVSIPLSYHLAEALPVDIHYVLFSWKQIFLLLLYMTLILIPFFFGALFIGIVLVNFEKKVPLVYGLNLFGSGAGGILAVPVLFLVPATDLPDYFWLPLVPSLFVWLASSKEYWKKRILPWSVTIMLIGIGAGIFFTYNRLPVNTDRYKAISHIRLLERQSEAKRVATKYGPRGIIDVYESPYFHNALFASPNADVLPPKQYALLIDGNMAGTIFKTDSSDDVSILGYTPQSLPYRLVPSPKVLLLGEVDGTNVWLAKRYGASSVTVVQGNRQISDLLLNELKDRDGRVFSGEGIRVVVEEPYFYIARTAEKFDVIQIVEGEGMSSGVSGLKSLHESYLLTVESITDCYHKLTERGFITLTRGIEAPPRDNLKIFSLFTRALEYAGVRAAEKHLLQSRNYLAVNTMIAKSPVSETTIKKYRDSSVQLLLDTEYFPGIDMDIGPQINRIEGPQGTRYSYLHYGDMKILSRERKNFFHEWPYNIEPPTDSRPYFYDFFKWRSLALFIKTYGRGWLQHLEIGYFVLIISFLETVLIAFIGTILPLTVFKAGHVRAKRAGAVLIYFFALGIAFMFIEVVFIHKFTRFMGNPVYSATATITAMLVFAGIGSMTQNRKGIPRVRRVRIASFAIVVLVLVYLIVLDETLTLFSSFDVRLRFMVILFALAPLSFFMGWMFPNGLSILEGKTGDLVPWAWGINGFASVIAAPLSVMISMTYGFYTVLTIAALLYLFSGYAIGRFA